MCLKNKIQQTLAEIAEKQDRLAKLEKLESATAPVKNLLMDLLVDYSQEAPEELPNFWQEILTIGQQHGLSVQPLALDELRQWEAANAENERLKAELEKEKYNYQAMVAIDRVLNQKLEEAERQLAEVRSQIPAESVIEDKNAIRQELENLYEEALTENTEAASDSIRALTLWQPWASLIAKQVKRIETRSWSTNYRGPIAIHSAKRPIYTGIPELLELLPTDCELPLGAVVAIANLVDCIEMTPEFIAQQSEQELLCGDWQPGRFAWILEIIRPVVPPIQVSGGQKLWNWVGTSVNAELEYLENKRELLGLVQISRQALADRQSKSESATTTEPEYKPEEAYDTVESILKSNGFSQHDTDMPPDWDASELYENYRGWDIFYSVPNGGIVAIGLNNSESNQCWDASTEYIQEVEGNTFPECLGDYDVIVAWTKQLINQVVAVTPVESLEVPGQLALEFSEPEPEVLTGDEYDAAVEEELGCNWEDDEPTQLQKLLVGNSNFTFEDLGVSVAVESVFTEEEETEEETEEENEEDSGEPDIVEVEEARFTVSNAEGKTKEYYHDAEQLVRDSQRFATIVRLNAERYAEQLLQDLKKDEEIKEKIARWNADETLQSNQPSSQSVEPEAANAETPVKEIGFKVQKFETMGFQVQVYPQHSDGKNFVAATFRFLDTTGRFIFDRSLLKAELGDLTCKVVAEQLIMDYQAKEVARLEKLANPYAKEEDKFVELVKLSNDVGYLKEKATGKILKGYAAFSNKKTNGSKTETQAKARAQKWANFLKGTYQLECLLPRISKRMVSNNRLQPFAYEIKIVNPSIGQLVKLAEEDLSLLPLELEENQARSEVAHSEIPHDSRNGETIATENVTEKEALTDNEVKIVELIRAALSKFNAEAVQEINSTEVPELVRNKVWTSLTEEEQKVYELLLKLEFVEAPDFSVKIPEFITRVDGKQGKSVFLTLRAIDGVSSRVWRYQGQIGDGGYSHKEAAAVAAWL